MPCCLIDAEDHSVKVISLHKIFYDGFRCYFLAALLTLEGYPTKQYDLLFQHTIRAAHRGGGGGGGGQLGHFAPGPSLKGAPGGPMKGPQEAP